MNRLIRIFILSMWALCACNASSTPQQTIQRTTPPRTTAESRVESAPKAAAAPSAAPQAAAIDAVAVANPPENPSVAPDAPQAHGDTAEPQDAANDDNDAVANGEEAAANDDEADVANDALAAANDETDAANDAVANDGDTANAADAPVADGESHRIDSQDPLSEEQARLLDEIPWDADPAVLNAVIKKNEGGHFLYSDEMHPELFLESIENRGGVYIGIGTDQGYMFMGWQRPALAFLVDYDPWVIVLHRIYFMLFRRCDDGDCILEFFQNKPEAIALLKTQEAIDAGLNPKLAIEVFRSGARAISHELRNARKMREKNFMNDAETYNYIKQMILSGRARTFQANLLGEKTFLALSETLNALGIKVTTLYLSNAEQYWNYTEQFKKNMLALPAAEGALVLRTYASKLLNRDYHYSAQPFPVFAAWLQHPKGKNVSRIVDWAPVEGPNHFPFSVSDRMPPAPKEETKP